jgi:hypothetical protein
MIKLIVLSVGLIITIVFGVIPSIFGELTTGDIAQFTERQERTYRTIGTDIALLDSERKGTQNNSTLSNEEIQNQIMELGQHLATSSTQIHQF